MDKAINVRIVNDISMWFEFIKILASVIFGVLAAIYIQKIKFRKEENNKVKEKIVELHYHFNEIYKLLDKFLISVNPQTIFMPDMLLGKEESLVRNNEAIKYYSKINELIIKIESLFYVYLDKKFAPLYKSITEFIEFISDELIIHGPFVSQQQYSNNEKSLMINLLNDKVFQPQKTYIDQIFQCYINESKQKIKDIVKINPLISKEEFLKYFQEERTYLK